MHTKYNIKGTIVLHLFRDCLIPVMNNIYPNKEFIIQQDGATSHTSSRLQFLEQNDIAYMKKD